PALQRMRGSLQARERLPSSGAGRSTQETSTCFYIERMPSCDRSNGCLNPSLLY
ncbi:Hypothetical predicted protein, partial [Podarcis lilfordi]